MAYCQQAGARAADRAVFYEAVTYFEQALAALGHLPETPGTRGMAIDLRLDLAGRALLNLGEYGRGLALLREAEALARVRDDRARLARVLALAYMLRVRASSRRYSGGPQALALATAHGDIALQAEASVRLGMAYCCIGDYRRAAELFRQTVAAAGARLRAPALT